MILTGGASASPVISSTHKKICYRRNQLGKAIRTAKTSLCAEIVYVKIKKRHWALPPLRNHKEKNHPAKIILFIKDLCKLYEKTEIKS